MKQIRHYILLFILLPFVTGCEFNGDSTKPLTLKKISSGQQSTDLLVMFPGINSPGTDFIEHDFVSLYRQYNTTADIILVDTWLAYIKDGNIAERIQTDIVKPAIASGYKNIWFVGISLGGFAALIYDKTYQDQVKGILLMGPYLGQQGTIEDLIRYPSLVVWSGKYKENSNKTSQLWQYYTKRHENNKLKLNHHLYLAFGDNDRFNKSHELFSTILNKNNIYTNDGGHNWVTWKRLWKVVLKENVIKY